MLRVDSIRRRQLGHIVDKILGKSTTSVMLHHIKNNITTTTLQQQRTDKVGVANASTQRDKFTFPFSALRRN